MNKKTKKPLEFSQKAFISIIGIWFILMLFLIVAKILFNIDIDVVEVIRILVAIPLTTIGVFGGKWGYENGKKIDSTSNEVTVETRYESTNMPI